VTSNGLFLRVLCCKIDFDLIPKITKLSDVRRWIKELKMLENDAI